MSDEERRERKREAARQYRETRREEYNAYHREYSADYYQRHKEEIKARNREYQRRRRAELARLKEEMKDMLLISQDGTEVVPAGAVNLSIMEHVDEDGCSEWRVGAYSLSPGADGPEPVCLLAEYGSREDAVKALGDGVARCGKPGGGAYRFPSRAGV